MKSFFNEETVEVGDESLRLVLDFRALDAIETVTGQSMTDIIPQLANPPHSLVIKVLWGLLLRDREGISLQGAADIGANDEKGRIGLAIANLISRAFNIGEKGENPPKRRGKSKASSKNG